MNTEYWINSIRSYEKETQTLKAKIQNNQQLILKMKQKLLEEMQNNGVLSEEAGGYVLQRRRGSLSVNIEDAEKLPHNLRTEEITYKPNKKVIKQLLQDGEEVEGATLERGSDVLVIKTKGE